MSSSKPDTANGSCPACGESCGESEPVCQKCGAPLSKPCPKCGLELRLNVPRCSGCGTNVATFAQVESIVAAMRLHLDKQSRLLKEKEESRQRQLNAKLATETSPASDDGSLNPPAEMAVKILEAKFKTIQSLRHEGRFEEAFMRLESIRAISAEWGPAESQWQEILRGEFAASLEKKAFEFLAKKNPAEAWQQLSRLENLVGELNEPQTQLYNQVVTAWMAVFHEEFAAMLQAGEYELAFRKLDKMSWLPDLAELVTTWSEAFGRCLTKFKIAGNYAQAVAEVEFLAEYLDEQRAEDLQANLQTPTLGQLLRQKGWPQRLAEIKARRAQQRKRNLLAVAVVLMIVVFGWAIWWWGFHLPKQRRAEAARQATVHQAIIKAQKAAALRHNQERIAAAAKDNPFVNSLGMKFVPVPGTPVLFGIWDVRVQDFETFVKATGYNATGGMYSVKNGSYGLHGDNWNSPGFSQRATHPVCGVSWNDANAFCEWLTKKERVEEKINDSQSYRLPTDWEWSTAVGLNEARGGIPAEKDAKSLGIYPWGIGWPPPLGVANYAGSEAKDSNWPTNWTEAEGYRDGYARTSPVGSFATNRFGLYDMGGNLWQWCEDEFSPGSGTHVTRGASWSWYDSSTLLSSRRHNGKPGYRANFNGFRCVLSHQLQPEVIHQANILKSDKQIETYPVGYADFPASLRVFLDRLTADMKTNGGFCIAGRVNFSDDTTIASGKDLMINFRRGIDEPIMVYPNGWFITRRPLSVRYQKGGNIDLRAFDYDAIDYPVEPPTNEITYIGLRMNLTPAGNFSTIQGRINDEHGSPIVGARVSLGFPFPTGLSRAPHKTLKTTADGKFIFSGLSPTSYRLYAAADETTDESTTCSLLPGEVFNLPLTLYPVRKIFFNYVCQTNGTCDFTTGHLLQGRMTWEANNHGMSFAKQQLVAGNKLDNRPDLILEQIQNQLNFDCNYGSSKRNGFYDAGAVDFNSVTNAAESGYSMNRRPCQVGHVYVVKTYDGNYAKLIVMSD